jgi:hypothetical protein
MGVPFSRSRLAVPVFSHGWVWKTYKMKIGMVSNTACKILRVEMQNIHNTAGATNVIADRAVGVRGRFCTVPVCAGASPLCCSDAAECEALSAGSDRVDRRSLCIRCARRTQPYLALEASQL